MNPWRSTTFTSVTFSIAYAAMNGSIHPHALAHNFSIAYAAMNFFFERLDLRSHFSIAYAAMN